MVSCRSIQKNMEKHSGSMKNVTKLMFRLLPAQVLLAATGLVNGIISGYFASNYIGTEALAAIGFYMPLNMLISAISNVLIGGCVILCGRFLSRNDERALQKTFSLSISLTLALCAVLTTGLLVLSLFDLTGFLTGDSPVRPAFNRYVLGQALGVFPFLLGNLLTAVLSLENKRKLITAAGIACFISNLFFNILFICILGWGVFGLAAAAALSCWALMLVQLPYYFSGASKMKYSFERPVPAEIIDIVKTGYPGAASMGYQSLRGLIVNHLLQAVVGSVAISAYAAVGNLFQIFWAIPNGMLAVCRMLVSVSIGEEDRQTLTDITRTMFRAYVPLMTAVSLCIIAMAVPLTSVYIRDTSDPVFLMTVRGLQILPLCMPLSLICMYFTCWGQASGKQVLVNILAVADGVIGVALFSFLLIRPFGIHGVYAAGVLNGVLTTVVIILYSWIQKGRIPRNADDLMVIPEDFGAAPEDRMDLTVRSIEDAVQVSQKVQLFCKGRSIDPSRANLAAMALEEMAGNVVLHGFVKDKKRHTVDIRVVHKGDDVILRIRDDCIPFDPAERLRLTDPENPDKNLGIRTVFQIARDISYQNILGMNVTTIRI